MGRRGREEGERKEGKGRRIKGSWENRRRIGKREEGGWGKVGKEKEYYKKGKMVKEGELRGRRWIPEVKGM